MIKILSMIKKLKLFLWIAIVALTGGCAKFNDPKPSKEECEVALRIIEVYADKGFLGLDSDEERKMYMDAKKIIKDFWRCLPSASSPPASFILFW